ncbi:hypothetical protein [Cellulophaga fucicola]|uniref:Tetratricopeptide repeat-containing protein n=1 Tax=Cellulophaga fucicola TaxID=76595 RepID=A0A1K1NVR0_9FLAO|nr:hypothetical protein [Cellulophaga fucicola]SFW39317.1 hypothetical protein SAMN05660313_01405 [Cellulophaga fucicola]
MKLPKRIKEVSIDTEIQVGVYPPNGFLQFYEAGLGNGDYFGLYWEFGKENEEPIVCEMIHDEGIIKPSFSSLDKFLEWYTLNDFDYGDEEIDDEKLVYNYLEKGNQCLQQNNVEKAIEFYKASTESFGELSENWFKLASQYKRIGNELDFQKSIINAVISNWAIDFPSQNAVRMLKNLTPVAELKDHPLLRNREKIDFNFGGQKENKNYEVIKAIFTELYELGDHNRALLLEQNYALMMYWETSSFQERNNFDIKEWRNQFSQKTKSRIELNNI